MLPPRGLSMSTLCCSTHPFPGTAAKGPINVHPLLLNSPISWHCCQGAYQCPPSAAQLTHFLALLPRGHQCPPSAANSPISWHCCQGAYQCPPSAAQLTHFLALLPRGLSMSTSAAQLTHFLALLPRGLSMSTLCCSTHPFPGTAAKGPINVHPLLLNSPISWHCCQGAYQCPLSAAQLTHFLALLPRGLSMSTLCCSTHPFPGTAAKGPINVSAAQLTHFLAVPAFLLCYSTSHYHTMVW